LASDAKKAATDSLDAGRGRAPLASHQVLKISKSDRYARRVAVAFAARA
jgi:hypothetical protein